MSNTDEVVRDALAQNDPLLRPLLESADPRDHDAALEELFRRAQPIVDDIVGYHRRRAMFDRADGEDVTSTVRVRLLLKLQRLAGGDAEPIATFDGYVARLAYNAVNDVFRDRDPERAALKRRLRQTALRDRRFAIEAAANGVVCRLQEQEGAAVVAPATIGALPGNLGDALEALLRAAGGPLLLNDVLAAMRTGPASTPRIGVDPDTPLLLLQRREDVAMLWKEILLLPPAQRAALLLNLRGDGSGSAIALLVLLGVTTFEALAEALGLTAEALAAIWGTLPLDDLSIAARLGVTRQQVINLRKSARRRLGRRRRWQ